MRSTSRSLEITTQTTTTQSTGWSDRNLAKIIIGSLSPPWNLEKKKMKLTCYVTSTSPWFLYAASVSLCFFFFARSSRVTCGVTTRAASYCGVDRPWQLLLHHHYVSALPLNTKYGEMPLGVGQSLTSRYCIAEKMSRKSLSAVNSNCVLAQFSIVRKSFSAGFASIRSLVKKPAIKIAL